MIEEFLKQNPDMSIHYRDKYMWWSIKEGMGWKVWQKGKGKWDDKEIYAGNSLGEALKKLKGE